MKKIPIFALATALCALWGLTACGQTEEPQNPPPPPAEEAPVWQNGQITYTAKDIPDLLPATPTGFAVYNEGSDTATVRSLSTELDNYGGVQTGLFDLDFSYPVIFQMDVVSCYTQYIVKMYVAGDTKPYYVLSDEGNTGLISVDVVDAMLCDKYREKQTQPDPGYAGGFKYANQTKRCSFYVMPKGPYDESLTATMELKSITVTNKNEPKISGITVTADGASGGSLSVTKGAEPVQLTCNMLPADIGDKSVKWTSLDEEVATVSESGLLSFRKVGKTSIVATSAVNMSKSGKLEVDVKSGYEGSAADMVAALNSLTEGAAADETPFEDIVRSTWSNMYETPAATSNAFLTANAKEGGVEIENYYEAGQPAGDYRVSFASADKVVYCVNGTLHVLSGADGVPVAYAAAGAKLASYSMPVLIVRGSSVKKFTAEVRAVTLVKNYTAQEIVGQWKDGNELVLASGKAELDGDAAKITETNKVMAYGGVYSEEFRVDTNKTVEIRVDVAETSNGNGGSKVMWDLRVLYFAHGVRVSNPRTLLASAKTGVSDIRFAPRYDTVRFYLVANGEDISGGAAEGANIKIRSIKIRYVD